MEALTTETLSCSWTHQNLGDGSTHPRALRARHRTGDDQADLGQDGIRSKADYSRVTWPEGKHSRKCSLCLAP